MSSNAHTMAYCECLTLTNGLALLVTGLLTVLFWKAYHAKQFFKNMGIGGPPALPVIGNNITIIRGTGLREVFTKWEKEYGKVYGIFMPTPNLVVSDLELVKEVLVKRFSSFVNKPTFPGLGDVDPFRLNLLTIEDDHWKHVRSQLSPAFSSGKLKRVVPAIQRVTKNLEKVLEDLAKTGEPVELKELCQRFTTDVIAGAAFAMEANSLNDPNDPFMKHACHMVQSVQSKGPIFLFVPFLARILNKLGFRIFPQADVDYLLGGIRAALDERRRENKKYGDFLQLLVEAERENAAQGQGQVDREIDHTDQLKTSKTWNRKGLTEGEMEANAFLFLFAGYDTVSTMLSLTLFALAANPDCLRKAQQEVEEKVGERELTYEVASELTYLDMVLNEVMRLHVPLMLTRTAGEDLDLGGYHVTKGTTVLIPSVVMHTDPDLWPDPMTFDPERFCPEARANRHPFAFMPFGLGPRNCIGMRFAQLEIRMALATVLRTVVPAKCEKTVYPPVFKPMRITANDGLWLKFLPKTKSE